MNKLPQVVIDARERANAAVDAYQASWDELQEIEFPTQLDLEKWINVKERFNSAQDEFEERLRQALGW
jgi:hypothetical protein